MHKRLLLTLAAGAALAAPGAAAAAPGDLDPGFAAPAGFALPATGGAVNDLLVDPQGRTVVSLDRGDGPGRMHVARLLPDGSHDPQFASPGAPAGIAEADIDPASDSDRANAVTLLPDGRIVAAGTYDKKLALARFKSDGTLDDTFNDANPNTPAGTVVTNIGSGTGGEGLQALAVAPDGDIVAAGTINDAQNKQRLLVVRYLESGERDQTFDEGDPLTPVGVAVFDVPDGTEEVHDVLVDPGDGSIVVTGTHRPPGGVEQFLVARLAGTGPVDASFGDGGAFLLALGAADVQEGAYATVRRPDGRLVTVGGVDADKGSGDTALVGLTPGGDLDPAFGEGGVRTVSFAPADLAGDVALLPDGRLMVSGGAIVGDDADMLLARFEPDGTLDGRFGNGGSVIRSLLPGVDVGAHVALAPDGSVITGGAGEGPDGSNGLVARFAGGDPAPPAEPERPAEPTAPSGQPDTPPRPPVANAKPVLAGAKLLRRRGRASVRFTLSEAATVRIQIARAVKRRGRTRFVRVGTLTRRVAAGARTLRLTDALARALRRPGRYRVTITAIDGAGLRSEPLRVAVRVRRR
jgi:uncharacterized delta-60 repeat protein